MLSRRLCFGSTLINVWSKPTSTQRRGVSSMTAPSYERCNMRAGGEVRQQQVDQRVFVELHAAHGQRKVEAGAVACGNEVRPRRVLARSPSCALRRD